MYRNLLVLGLVLGLASPALGQDYATDKGAWILGGSVSYASDGGELYENAEGDRLNTALVNPRALYFVSPGLAIGGQVVVQHTSQGDASFTTLGLGPEVAYYFGGPESTVYPFVAGNVAYATISSDGFDASGFGFGFGAGAAFMLSRSVALTAGGEYTIDNLSVDQVDESFTGNSFRLELGVSAFLF